MLKSLLQQLYWSEWRDPFFFHPPKKRKEGGKGNGLFGFIHFFTHLPWFPPCSIKTQSLKVPLHNNLVTNPVHNTWGFTTPPSKYNTMQNLTLPSWWYLYLLHYNAGSSDHPYNRSPPFFGSLFSTPSLLTDYYRCKGYYSFKLTCCTLHYILIIRLPLRLCLDCYSNRVPWWLINNFYLAHSQSLVWPNALIHGLVRLLHWFGCRDRPGLWA